MLNPISFMKAMRNPQKFLEEITKNNEVMSNPMAKNAIEMYRNGDSRGLQEFAENVCKEKGTTPDEIRKSIIQRCNLRQYILGCALKTSFPFVNKTMEVNKMFNGNSPSLADIAAVTGNNKDGWGDGNGWWVLIILFAIFGGWGNGFGGGYGNGGDRASVPCATQADVRAAEIGRAHV